MQTRTWVTILIIVITSACGGGGGGGGGKSTSPPLEPEAFFAEVVRKPFGSTQRDCAVSLSNNQGTVGDIVRIANVPPEMMDHATIRVISGSSDGEPSYGLALLRNVPGEEGSLEFSVPINPNGDLDGGTVELELGDGVRYCQRQSFVIQALPEANPAAASALADTLENWLEAVIEIYGQDPQTIRNTQLRDLDESLYLLKLYQIMFEGGPEAIIPTLRDAAADDDLLAERLLTAIDLEGAFAEQLTQFAMLPPLTLTQQAGQAETRTRQLRNDSASCEITLPSLSYDFAGADDIAPVMRIANSQAVANEVFSSINTAAGSIGLIPHPAVKAAAGIVGAAGLALQTSYGIVTDLLPSNWGTLTFTVTPTLWHEDRPETLLGQVTDAKAEAFSRSHNFSKDVVNHAFAAATILGGPAIGKRVPAGKVNGVSVADDLLGGVSLAIQDTMNSAIEEASDFLTVCVEKQSFGLIDVSEDRWSQANINGSAIVWTSQRDREFIGKRLGDAEIELVIRESEFGSSKKASRNVTTGRADVVSNVASISVKEPGEVITVEASRPDGAYSRDQIGIEVIPASAAVLQNTVHYDNDRVVFTLKTSTESKKYPFELRLFPTGKMLEPFDSSRDEIVKILNEGTLTINYEKDCVKPGDSIVFSATLDGFADNEQSVVWDVFGASVVDSDELSITVRAPANPGSFNVSAVATANSDVEDDVEVSVQPDCLRKILYPIAAFTTDGNGYYGTSDPDDPNPVCPTGEHDDTQSETLIVDETDIIAPPDTPEQSELWQTKQETLNSSLYHQSTRYNAIGESPNESCPSYSFSASSTGSAIFGSTAEGGLSVKLDANLQTDCKSIQDDNGDYVECAGASANTGVSGFYYLDIEEETTLRLSGSLQCSNLDGYIILTPVTATVSRFRNGQPVEPSDDNPTGVFDEEGSPRSPQLVNAVCEDPNELIIIDETFTLAGAEAGHTDLVVISLLGNFLITPGIIDKEGYGMPDISQIEPPKEGSYTGGGIIELELQLETK